MMLANSILRPGCVDDLRELIGEAAGNGQILEIRAGGSKHEIGAPARETAIVDVGAFTGVVDYEPSELVLTVRPATPLAEVENLLASQSQMLAFEPWDHGPLFGNDAGAATIGGIVAAAVAGPRRVSAGAVRDHLLGYSAVSGRGEAFKGGGKVVKNVTGYDTAKIVTGSWGQLVVFTELSVKVVPRPRFSSTVALRGLSPRAAVAAMSKALGSRCSPAAAAHLPSMNGEPALTAIRLEGFRESVELRAVQLREELADFAEASPMSEPEAEDAWTAIREVRPLATAKALWRVHIAPSQAATLSDRLEQLGVQYFYDWAGALAWVGAPTSTDIRGTVSGLDGHAALVRAPVADSKAIPARHPEPAAVAALATRVKQAFDPAGVLDPHRFD